MINRWYIYLQYNAGIAELFVGEKAKLPSKQHQFSLLYLTKVSWHIEGQHSNEATWTPCHGSRCI